MFANCVISSVQSMSILNNLLIASFQVFSRCQYLQVCRSRHFKCSVDVNTYMFANRVISSVQSMSIHTCLPNRVISSVQLMSILTRLPIASFQVFSRCRYLPVWRSRHFKCSVDVDTYRFGDHNVRPLHSWGTVRYTDWSTSQPDIHGGMCLKQGCYS